MKLEVTKRCVASDIIVLIRGINVDQIIFMVSNVSFENNITSLGVYGFGMNSVINTCLQ